MGETIANNKKDTPRKKIMPKGMILVDKIDLIGGFYVWDDSEEQKSVP